MSEVLHILLLITSLSICYQDIKTRQVYLLTFIILYLAFVLAYAGERDSFNTDFIIFNSGIVIVASCLFLLYYLLRYRLESLTKIEQSIGMGDVLLLPAFVISFSPMNMLIVLIFSFLVSLAYFLISAILLSKTRTIPLAGIQAFILSILWAIDYWGPFKMQSDYFNFF